MSAAVKLEDVLLDVVSRLERLEIKIEALTPLPLALDNEGAAKLLSCSPSKVKGLKRAGDLRTVLVGKREMIPFSELVRITSIREKPKSAPTMRPRKGSTGYDANAEAEELERELRKRKR